MADIAILGSGGWGTALAVMLNNNGHNVTVWSAFESEIMDIIEDGENKRYLPGVCIDSSINLTSDISVASGKDLVILAVPSFAVRETCKKLKNILKDGQVVTNVAKGFEQNTTTLLSSVIKQELPNIRLTVLSGPSHAEEVGKGVPTSVVVASESIQDAEYVQSIVNNPVFRVYTNSDVTGVEICGALKNVIALCWGICVGMGLGDNTKAALIARGLSEITRLGTRLNANPSTFSGLAGIGDLVVTCCSTHSRNHRFGILVGKGVNVSEALRLIDMTVEGYYATAAALKLADELNVDAPIIQGCYDILYNFKRPKYVLNDLMQRPIKFED